jgi:hypothetical protein
MWILDVLFVIGVTYFLIKLARLFVGWNCECEQGWVRFRAGEGLSTFSLWRCGACNATRIQEWGAWRRPRV